MADQMQQEFDEFDKKLKLMLGIMLSIGMLPAEWTLKEVIPGITKMSVDKIEKAIKNNRNKAGKNIDDKEAKRLAEEIMKIKPLDEEAAKLLEERAEEFDKDPKNKEDVEEYAQEYAKNNKNKSDDDKIIDFKNASENLGMQGKNISYKQKQNENQNENQRNMSIVEDSDIKTVLDVRMTPYNGESDAETVVDEEDQWMTQYESESDDETFVADEDESLDSDPIKTKKTLDEKKTEISKKIENKKNTTNNTNSQIDDEKGFWGKAWSWTKKKGIPGPYATAVGSGFAVFKKAAETLGIPIISFYDIGKGWLANSKKEREEEKKKQQEKEQKRKQALEQAQQQAQQLEQKPEALNATNQTVNKENSQTGKPQKLNHTNSPKPDWNKEQLEKLTDFKTWAEANKGIEDKHKPNRLGALDDSKVRYSKTSNEYNSNPKLGFRKVSSFSDMRSLTRGSAAPKVNK